TAKADAPHDGTHVGASDVQAPRGLSGLPGRLVHLARRSLDPSLSDELVDAAIDAPIHRVGLIEILHQIVGELDDASGSRHECAVELHAFAGKGAQIDVVSTITA